MTMPHLMNCRHSEYGICDSCDEPDQIYSVGLPPSNSRKVLVSFSDDNDEWVPAFFWRAEGCWYKSHGSKAKRNAVHPKRWKPIV